MPSVPAMCRGGSAWAFQSKTEKEKQAWSSCDASTNRSSRLFESRSRSNFDPQPDKDRNAAAFGGSGLSSCITLLRALASFGRRPMEPWPSSAFAAMRRGVQSGSSLYGRGRSQSMPLVLIFMACCFVRALDLRDKNLSEI